MSSIARSRPAVWIHNDRIEQQTGTDARKESATATTQEVAAILEPPVVEDPPPIGPSTTTPGVREDQTQPLTDHPASSSAADASSSNDNDTEAPANGMRRRDPVGSSSKYVVDADGNLTSLDAVGQEKALKARLAALKLFGSGWDVDALFRKIEKMGVQIPEDVDRKLAKEFFKNPEKTTEKYANDPRYHKTTDTGIASNNVEMDPSAGLHNPLPDLTVQRNRADIIFHSEDGTDTAIRAGRDRATGTLQGWGRIAVSTPPLKKEAIPNQDVPPTIWSNLDEKAKQAFIKARNLSQNASELSQEDIAQLMEEGWTVNKLSADGKVIGYEGLYRVSELVWAYFRLTVWDTSTPEKDIKRFELQLPLSESAASRGPIFDSTNSVPPSRIVNSVVGLERQILDPKGRTLMQLLGYPRRAYSSVVPERPAVVGKERFAIQRLSPDEFKVRREVDDYIIP